MVARVRAIHALCGVNELRTQDEYGRRGIDPEANLVASNFENGDFDFFSDLDRFARSARENEHGSPSMEMCEAAMLAQLTCEANRGPDRI